MASTRADPARFFAGIIRDITERKRLDDALRQSAKLESLGVLAGGIAHDFNNLLTGILGNISLALDMVNQSDPAREPLENAIEASERAAKLTKQLLAYAGKGRFVVEPIGISRSGAGDQRANPEFDSEARHSAAGAS